MNSTRSRVGIFCIGSALLLFAGDGRCFEFCIPNSQNNYCQPPPAPPDTTPPTITMNPVKGAKALKVPEVVLTGGASDNSGNVKVKFRLENYYGNTDFQTAQGINPWTATVSGLAGGQNYIRVQATDGTGNMTEVVQSVFYAQKLPLVLNMTGQGTIAPNFTNKNLQVGQFYTVTAKPGKGYAFAGWSGDQAANTAALQFLMLTNTVLQVNFVPTPFTSAAGIYQGDIAQLISGPDLGGAFKAMLKDTGEFTARFQFGSKKYLLRGTLSADGSYHGSIHRKGLAPIDVQLLLDINGRTWNGSFTDFSVSQDPTGAMSVMMRAGGSK